MTINADAVDQILNRAVEEGDVIYMSPAEVADALGKSTNTVYSWLKTGYLAGYQVGGVWLIPATRDMGSAAGKERLELSPRFLVRRVEDD